MKICDHDIEVGDYIRVRYTTGRQFKGSILSGVVTKLWNTYGDTYPVAPMKQGQIDNGWCFHDHDRILEHRAANQQSGGD